MALLKPRATKFLEAWCNRKAANQDCSLWLLPDSSDDKRAYCSLCSSHFFVGSAGFGAVENHAKRKKHSDRYILKLAKASSSTSIDSYFKPVQPPSQSQSSVSGESKPTNFETQVLRAELRHALSIVEHQQSFSSADHNKYKPMFPDSKIAQAFKCQRQKTTYIVTEAIAPTIRQEMIQDVNSGCGYYSLAIDESNQSMGSQKFLSIMISFVSIKRKRLLIVPLETVTLPDGRATTIEAAVAKTCHDLGLHFKSCVCIMSDGPSVMTGRHAGFHTLMAKHAPHLLKMSTCSLHHVSNATRAACDKLGTKAEKLADLIHSYFLYTSRWTKYERVQELLDLQSHRFLRRVETRWIQLLPVVDRLVEQFEGLKEYFLKRLRTESPSDFQKEAVKTIRELLEDDETEFELLFLQAVLPALDKFEKAYQSKSVKIHSMYSDLRTLFKEVLACFLTTDHVSSNAKHLSRMKFPFEAFLPESQVFIGEKARCFLSSREKTFQKLCIVRARQFYCELAKYLQSHLPLADSVLKFAQFLDPSKVSHLDSSYAVGLAREMHFSEKDISLIDSDFRRFNLSLTSKRAEEIAEDVLEFWLPIVCATVRNANSDASEDSGYQFPALRKLVLASLSIPHGNASVERVFADLADLFTKKRTQFDICTIDACLLTKGFLKATDLTCESFVFSDAYITAGFHARHSWKVRLERQRKEDEEKQKKLSMEKELAAEVAQQIEASTKAKQLQSKEDSVRKRKLDVEAQADRAAALLEKYQRQVAALAIERKALEKETEGIEKKKQKLNEKLTESVISNYLKK